MNEKLKAFWEWFDNSNMDLWLVSVFILFGTWRLTGWAMAFASGAYERATGDMSSVGIAAVIAAVTGPYAAVQAAALAFLFKVRA